MWYLLLFSFKKTSFSSNKFILLDKKYLSFDSVLFIYIGIFFAEIKQLFIIT